MDADLQQAHQFNPIATSGLTRYKSAPSSYFSNFVMEYKDVNDFLRPPPPKPPSPQIDRIFAQLASEISGNNNNQSQNQVDPTVAPVMKLEIEPQASSPVVAFTPTAALPPPHPLSRTSSGVDSSYRGLKASTPVRIPVVEKQSSSNNNLVRHSSLPAGLFSQSDVHNAAAAYFGNGNNQANSSTDMMSTYSGILGNDSSKQQNDDVLNDYMQNEFWADSTSTEKLLSGVKRERTDDDFLSVDDVKPFSGESNLPIEEMKKAGMQTGMLSHHLSLPKSSLEMLSAMEKFLELQDSTVAVGTRAKRGCATHPRSIAERVRRTKISERMRRLQELVPNMDKQTNTSDMLDLAVDYIKDLQTRVQILKACSEKCTC